MKTIVETFIVEETSHLIYDNDALDKWNSVVDELGLKGQTNVIVKDKSPVPFLWMNSSLIETFRLLCPTRVLVEVYDKSPIPLEILQLLQLSVKEHYFDKIQIWYNETDKDPVCIGLKVKPEYLNKEEYYWNVYSEKYLIGRWADVKASLDSLIALAKSVFIQSTTKEYEQKIRDYKRNIEDIQTEADRKFGNDMPETILPF